LANALKKIGARYIISNHPSVIKKADKIILPGVGSAGSAMERLYQTKLDKIIPELSIPFLGICLGMQVLFDWSEEDKAKCLGIISGQVKKFNNNQVKVPQIGWNQVIKHITYNIKSKKIILRSDRICSLLLFCAFVLLPARG